MASHSSSRLRILFLVLLTTTVVSIMAVAPCVGLRQDTPVNGISVTGVSTVFNSSNGTTVFGFRIQSQIPTATVVLGYVQRSGALTNATLTLAAGNSSTNGWWRVKIEPQLIQQSFPNGTRTYEFEAMTLYVSNANGTTIFPINQGEMGRESTNISTVTLQFPVLMIVALVIAGIFVTGVLFIYSRRQSIHHPRLNEETSV